MASNEAGGGCEGEMWCSDEGEEGGEMKKKMTSRFRVCALIPY